MLKDREDLEPFIIRFFHFLLDRGLLEVFIALFVGALIVMPTIIQVIRAITSNMTPAL